MNELAPFKREITDAQREMEKELARGEDDLNAYAVMIWREAIQLGTDQLHDHPEIALGFKTQRAAGGTAEDRWWKWIISRAIEIRDPTIGNPDLYRLTVKTYQATADLIFAKSQYLVEVGFRIEGKHYDLYQQVNPVLIDVGAHIAYSLRTYPGRHRYDEGFLQLRADEALIRLLRDERPDLDVALRLVNELPRDEHYGPWHPDPDEPPSGGDDRPLYQDVIEFAVSCIPVIGSAVMTYEAVSGQDLFGRDLSVAERGLLAAGVLLPMAAHFVEGSHAIYSAERMTRLYGGEVEAWERSLALSEKVSAEAGSFKTLAEVREALNAGKSIPSQLATETKALLSAIDIAKAGKGVPTVLSKAATDTFDRLVIADARWAELDANALERILKKKRVSGVQGQLAEEVLANRIAVWLADPAGKAALGLADVSARRLEFIPGHLITSISGRQLTDGMLVERLKSGRYAVWAVFEVKSSREAALGLSRTRVSTSRMSKADLADLEAEAEDAMKVLEERARRTGTPVSMTIDDIKKEIAQEHGGQIARDIERLYGDATDTLAATPQAIYVGGERVEVVISPRNRTMFFGVAPNDVSLSEVATELRGQGVSNFIALGLGYAQKDLAEAAGVVESALGLKK